MNLNDALRAIGAYLDLDGDALIEYAAEDNEPGSHDARTPPPGRNPFGIPYTADGKFLYALVRALKPARVLESGTNEGGSAVHIAMALKANGGETLVTVDTRPDSGQHIPNGLLPYVQVIHTDICEYVQRPNARDFGFIHEDASHEVHTVRAVYEALPTLMHDGGVIVSHDTAFGVREAILTGIRNAGYDEPPTWEWDESPCGFSIMKYAGVR